MRNSRRTRISNHTGSTLEVSAMNASTSVVSGGWTPLQDNLLLDAVQTHAGKWLPISNCLGSHRSPAQCEARHKHLESLGVTTVDDLLRLRANGSIATDANPWKSVFNLYDNQNHTIRSPVSRTSLAMNTLNHTIAQTINSSINTINKNSSGTTSTVVKRPDKSRKSQTPVALVQTPITSSLKTPVIQSMTMNTMRTVKSRHAKQGMTPSLQPQPMRPPLKTIQASSPVAHSITTTVTTRAKSYRPHLGVATNVFPECPQKCSSIRRGSSPSCSLPTPSCSNIAAVHSSSQAKLQSAKVNTKKSRKAAKVTRIHAAASEPTLLSKMKQTRLDCPESTINHTAVPVDSISNESQFFQSLEALQSALSMPPNLSEFSFVTKPPASLTNWTNSTSDYLTSECQPLLSSEANLLDAMFNTVQNSTDNQTNDINTCTKPLTVFNDNVFTLEDLFADDSAITFHTSKVDTGDHPSQTLVSSDLDNTLKNSNIQNYNPTLSMLNQLGSDINTGSEFTNTMSTHQQPIPAQERRINSSHLDGDLFDLINWDVDVDMSLAKDQLHENTCISNPIKPSSLIQPQHDLDSLDQTLNSLIFNDHLSQTALDSVPKLANDCFMGQIYQPIVTQSQSEQPLLPVNISQEEQNNQMLHDLFGKDFWAHSEMDLSSMADPCPIPLDALTPDMMQLYRSLSGVFPDNSVASLPADSNVSTAPFYTSIGNTTNTAEKSTLKHKSLYSKPSKSLLTTTAPPIPSKNSGGLVMPGLQSHNQIKPDQRVSRSKVYPLRKVSCNTFDTISSKPPCITNHHSIHPMCGDPTTPMNVQSDDDFLASNADESDLFITRDEVEDLYKETVEMSHFSHHSVQSSDFTLDSPDWINGSNNIFSVDQIQQIQLQLAQNFQLCVQSYCIERQLKGNPSRECQFWEAQLLNHTVARENAIARYGSHTLFNFNGADKVAHVLSHSFDHLSLEATEFAENYEWAVQLKIKKEFLGSGGFKGNSKIKSVRAAVLPENVSKLLEKFDSGFDEELKPNIVRVNRSHLVGFSPEEDALLLYGLLHYGFNDWPSIRAHYLPARTYSQIKYRYKNLVHRGKTANKIKEFYLQPFRALRLAENQLVISGAQVFGPAFKYATAQLLPQCPDTLIRTGWNDLVCIGQIKYYWDAIVFNKSTINTDSMFGMARTKKRKSLALDASTSFITKRPRQFHSSSGNEPIPAPVASKLPNMDLAMPITELLPAMSQADLVALWMSATIQLSKSAGIPIHADTNPTCSNTASTSQTTTSIPQMNADTRTQLNTLLQVSLAEPTLTPAHQSTDMTQVIPFINSDAFAALTQLIQQQIGTVPLSITNPRQTISHTQSASSINSSVLNTATTRLQRPSKIASKPILQTPKRTSPTESWLNQSSDAGYLASVQSSEPDLMATAPLTPPSFITRPMAKKSHLSLVTPIERKPASSLGQTGCALNKSSTHRHGTTQATAVKTHLNSDMMNWNSDFETDFESGVNAGDTPRSFKSSVPPLITARRSSLVNSIPPGDDIKRRASTYANSPLNLFPGSETKVFSHDANVYGTTDCNIEQSTAFISFSGAYNCDTDSDDDELKVGSSGQDGCENKVRIVSDDATLCGYDTPTVHLTSSVVSKPLEMNAVNAVTTKPLARKADSRLSIYTASRQYDSATSDNEYINNGGISRTVRKTGSRLRRGRNDPMLILRSATSRRNGSKDFGDYPVLSKRGIVSSYMSS
ncbi:hypothetical protein BDV3_001877 [Batrachochytrium dendrobatidis]